MKKSLHCGVTEEILILSVRYSLSLGPFIILTTTDSYEAVTESGAKVVSSALHTCNHL